MKRTIVLLSVLLMPAMPVLAVEEAELLHAGYGALAATAAGSRLYHCAPRLGRWERLGAAALGSGLAVAATRELADAASHTDSYGRNEFAATMVGAAVGAGVSELVNGWFFVSASGDRFFLGHRGRW